MSSIEAAQVPQDAQKTPELKSQQENNFRGFGRVQELIKNRILGTEDRPVSPRAVARMSQEQRGMLALGVRSTLQEHSSSRGLAEPILKQLDQYFETEKKLDQWWSAQGKTDAEVHDTARRTLMTAITSTMNPPLELQDNLLRQARVQQIHGGVAIHVPLELYAKLMRLQVAAESKLPGESDEQAFVRLSRKNLVTASARLLDKSEIAQNLGLPPEMEIAIGFGNFVDHEQEEILGKKIDANPLVAGYHRLHIPEIAGSTSENILIGLHDLAARLGDKKRFILLGDLGITPEDMARHPEAVKLLSVINQMAREQLQRTPTPEMRQQLMEEIQGGVISPEALVSMWYKRLHPEEAQRPLAEQRSVTDIVRSAPEVRVDDLRMMPGVEVKLGRKGRSIHETYAYQAGEVIDLPNRVVFPNGDAYDFPAGRKAKIKSANHVLTAGGQSIIYDAELFEDLGGPRERKIDDVVVKEVFYNPEREARIETVKDKASAEQRFDEIARKYGALPPNIPDETQLEAMLLDMRKLLKPRFFPPVSKSDPDWNSFINQDLLTKVKPDPFDPSVTVVVPDDSLVWGWFMGRLSQAISGSNVEFPFSSHTTDYLVEMEDPGPPPVAKFADATKRRRLVEAMKKALGNVGKLVEDPHIDTPTEKAAKNYNPTLENNEALFSQFVKKQLSNIHDVRDEMQRQVAIEYRLDSPDLAKLYGAKVDPLTDVTDPRSGSFLLVERKESPTSLNNLDPDTKPKEWNDMFPDVDSKLNCMLQVIDAIQQIHNIKEDKVRGLPAMKVAHLDLNPGNILLKADASGRFSKAVVTDFGASHILKSGRVVTYSKGVPPYASPEQFGSSPQINQRSDIFSLGCEIYKIYTGRDLPVKTVITDLTRNAFRDELMDMLRLDLKDVKPASKKDKLVKDFGEIFVKATQTTPKDRYSAQEMYNAVLNLYGEYQASKPYPAKESLPNRLLYLDALWKSAKKPAGKGAIDLENDYSFMFAALEDSEAKVMKATPPLSVAVVEDAIGELKEFVDHAEKKWKHAGFTEAVRLNASKRIRAMIERSADPSVGGWGIKNINELQSLVAEIKPSHNDAGETAAFVLLFENVVRKNPALAENVLDKLQTCTDSSNGWTNTRYKDASGSIKDRVVHILNLRGVNLDYRTIRSGVEVIGALPPSVTRDRATEDFLKQLGPIAINNRKASEMVGVIDTVVHRKWKDNLDILPPGAARAALESMDYIVRGGPGGVRVSPEAEWIETIALLTGAKVDPSFRHQAYLDAQIIVQNILPQLINVDLAFDSLARAGRTSSSEFSSGVWTIEAMSDLLEARLSMGLMSQDNLEKVLDVVIAIPSGTSESDAAVRRVAQLMDKMSMVTSGSDYIMDALIAKGDPVLATEEIVAVAQKCVDEQVRKGDFTKFEDRWWRYGGLVGQAVTASEQQTNDFVDSMVAVRTNRVVNGAVLLPEIENLVTDRVSYPNAHLRPPYRLAETAQKVIVESARQAEPIDATMLSISTRLVDATSPDPARSKLLAENYRTMLTTLARTYPQCRVVVLQELDKILATSWTAGSGLEELQKNPDFASKKDQVDIITATVRDATTEVTKVPPSLSSVRFNDALQSLADTVTFVDSKSASFAADFPKNVRKEVMEQMRNIIRVAALESKSDASLWNNRDTSRFDYLKDLVKDLDPADSETPTELQNFLQLFVDVVSNNDTLVDSTLDKLGETTEDSALWTNSMFRDGSVAISRCIRLVLDKGIAEVDYYSLEKALHIVDVIPSRVQRRVATEGFMNNLKDFAIDHNEHDIVMQLFDTIAQPQTSSGTPWRSPSLRQLPSAFTIQAVESIIADFDSKGFGGADVAKWIETSVLLAGTKIQAGADTDLRRDDGARSVEHIVSILVPKIRNDSEAGDVLDAFIRIHNDPDYNQHRLPSLWVVQNMSDILQIPAYQTLVSGHQFTDLLDLSVAIPGSVGAMDQGESAAQRVTLLLQAIASGREGTVLDAFDGRMEHSIANQAFLSEDVVEVAKDCLQALVTAGTGTNMDRRLDATKELIMYAGTATEAQTEQFIRLLEEIRRKNLLGPATGAALMPILEELAIGTALPVNANSHLRPPIELGKAMIEIIKDSVGKSEFVDTWLVTGTKVMDAMGGDPQSVSLAESYGNLLIEVAEKHPDGVLPALQELRTILIQRVPPLHSTGLLQLQTTQLPLTNAAMRIAEKTVRDAGGGLLDPLVLERTRDIIGESTQDVVPFYSLLETVVTSANTATQLDKMREAMDHVRDINGGTWRNPDLPNNKEQVKVLASVAEALPRVSGISVADAEFGQWSREFVVNIAHHYGSLDETTQRQSAGALRNLINHLDGITGLYAGSADTLLLELYRNVTVPPVPELQDCFALANRKLLEGIESRVQASPTVDDVRLLGDLASKALSQRVLGANLSSRTTSVLNTLSAVQSIGDPRLDVEVSGVYAKLLDADVANIDLTGRDSLLRMSIIGNMDFLLNRVYSRHRQTIPVDVLKTLSQSLPAYVLHQHYTREASRLAAVSDYIDLLDGIAKTEPKRKFEVKQLLKSFETACGNEVERLDTELASEAFRSRRVHSSIVEKIDELKSYLRHVRS